MEKWCEAICEISDYTVDGKVKQKIKLEKEKEEKSNEGTGTKG